MLWWGALKLLKNTVSNIRVNYQINTFALKAASGGRRGREDLVRDVGKEGDERIADLQIYQ